MKGMAGNEVMSENFKEMVISIKLLCTLTLKQYAIYQLMVWLSTKLQPEFIC